MAESSDEERQAHCRKDVTEGELMIEWLSDRSSRVVGADDVVDWLPGQTPDTWHSIVTSWNHECGRDPLEWVVEQPGCDKVTAACVFFSTSIDTTYPGDGDILIQTVDPLLETIGRNWAAGLYPTEKFSSNYDQRAVDSYLRAMVRMREQGLSMEHPMPQDGCRVFKGEKPKTDYIFHDYAVILTFEKWAERNGISLES